MFKTLHFLTYSTPPIFPHEDVMPWRFLTHYWYFIRGNHLSMAYFPNKVPVVQSFMFSLMIGWMIRLPVIWDVMMVEIFSMMTSSNGNIFHVTGPLCREFTSHWWILLTRSSDTELWCFLWLCLDKRLSKQSRHCWFEMQLECGTWYHHRDAYSVSWAEIWEFPKSRRDIFDAITISKIIVFEIICIFAYYSAAKFTFPIEQPSNKATKFGIRRSWKLKVKPNLVRCSNTAITISYISVFVSSW